MFRVGLTSTNGSGRRKGRVTFKGNITVWLLSVIAGIALFTSLMAQTLADAAPHHAQRILAGLSRLQKKEDCPSMRKAVAREIEKDLPAPVTPEEPLTKVTAAETPPLPEKTEDKAAPDRVFACPIRDQGFDQLLWRQDGNRVFPRGCL